MKTKKKVVGGGIPEPERGDAVVIDKAGNVVRIYTKELHGKEYGYLAKGFAEKKGYSVRKV